MMTLVIPSCGSAPENIRRTIDSCRDICNETIIISTAFFLEDQRLFSDITDRVVQLDWNFIMKHGFGEMSNQATSHAKNDWLLLLGVSETYAEPYTDIGHALHAAPKNMVFRCDHHNDPNRWTRIHNRQGGTHWSGLIHECIVGGPHGDVLFRMQDFEKVQKSDPVKQEILKWIKAVSYHIQYWRLLNDSSLLQGTDPGWLKFVNGSREHIIEFRESHQDLISPCLSGDLVAFLKAVDSRMDKGEEAKGVNYSMTGTPMSEGSMPCTQ